MDEDEMLARLNELVSEYVTVVYVGGEFGVSWSNRTAMREAAELAEALDARKEQDNG
jgi:hypothetical protein